MSMRRCLALLCLVLAAACTSDRGSGKAREEVNPANPLALVGDWSVAAKGAPQGTVLILRVRPAVTDLTITMPCGKVGGAWAADGRQSLFVGDVYAGSGGCFTNSGIMGVSWLGEVTGFRTNGPSPLLVNGSGATVATLTHAASSPQPSLTTSASLASRHFGEPAPLPKVAVAVSPERLAGRWIPITPRTPGNAFVAFLRKGAWSGSDGCNGLGARYTLGREGRILATTRPHTDIACDLSPVGEWVRNARRIGLVGDELVFYDRTGKELGRAKPAS